MKATELRTSVRWRLGRKRCNFLHDDPIQFSTSQGDTRFLVLKIKTTTSPRKIKIIKEKIRRHPKKNLGKFTKELNLSRTSVRNITSRYPGMCSNCRRPAHWLLVWSRPGFRRVTNCCRDFSGTPPQCPLRRREIFHDRTMLKPSKWHDLKSSLVNGHLASVPVWAGVTWAGKTPLDFVDHNNILMKEMLLWRRSHLDGRPWTIQQDSAPAHKVKVVQQVKTISRA